MMNILICFTVTSVYVCIYVYIHVYIYTYIYQNMFYALHTYGKKTHLGAFGEPVRMPFGIPTFHVRVLGLESWLYFRFLIPSNVHPGKQW